MDQETPLPSDGWSGAVGKLSVLAPAFFAEGSAGGAAPPVDTAWELADFAWDPVAMVRLAASRALCRV